MNMDMSERLVETPRVTLVLAATTLYEVDDTTGEVVGMADAPDDTAEVGEIAQFYHGRRTRVLAQKAALETERDMLLDSINASYGPLISEKENALKWLDMRFLDRLETFTKGMLGTGKERSFRMAGMLLGLRKAPAKLEITDVDAALRWAKAHCPAAVQVKESVLKSCIPLDGVVPDGAVLIPERDNFYIK